MTRQFSFPLYVGIAAFLTIIAVFVGHNVVDFVGVESRRDTLLVFLVAFSVAQTTVTYLMVSGHTDNDEDSSGTAGNSHTGL